MPPRWSILLPTHDRAEVVGYAIRSVLAQTVGDWELLVVGDGCSDDTGTVVESFTDDRIHWFDLPKAAGFGYANRNLALRKARGDLVGFMAHDDLLLPDHLDKLGRLFERSEVEWAYSRPLWIENDGTIVPFAIDLRRPDDLERFFKVGNKIPASCVAHRRECLDRYSWWPEELAQAGDWELWKRIIGPSGGANLAYQPEATCLHFRAHWRTGPTWGPAPLSSWLQTAHSGWWPPDLRAEVPRSALPQEAVWQLLAGDGMGWATRWREAVVSVIDGYAWSAAVELPQVERRLTESGSLLVNAGQNSKAIELVDMGLALAPASAGLLAVKAGALINLDDARGAEGVAREAIELDPGLPPAYGALGRALVAQERTAEAIDVLRAGIAARPDAAGLHTHLGWVLLHSGDVDGAGQSAREAGRLNPEAPGPKRILERIEASRTGPDTPDG